MPRVHFALVLAALLLVGTASADDGVAGIKPANLKGADLDLVDDHDHDPESERENFELLPGYEVNLFAADPMLANPVHMHWDSRGRLWVACSWAYPQLKPGEKPDDKIIILEDTDGDGAADKSTVFADGLYLPTGIELANGGCYVAQSPDVFFLKDTDGDDVADVKEVALTGFGIEDSHHSISAWRRGPGGWLYFQEGIFLHSQVETQHGVVRNFNGGVYQFNPRSGELRMFCRGTGGNPWGHVFDEWGQSFMVNNPRIMYLSPATGNSDEPVRIESLISTEKQCGGDLATGTHVGDDLRGQLLTGRFKSRTVVRYEFIEDGAGFSANVLEPLISSKHPNFRPVDVKIGPDGAVYVADWYNSIINHAQHDFRDPRRDHEHGRIWRITHRDRPLAKKPQLVGVLVPALVEQLASPETWTRHQARKELSERDPDEVLAAVEAWVDTLADDAPERHLVEAMWACQNVERPSETILRRVLAAKDGHARSAGARVLRYWHDGVSDPIALLATAAADPFPRARMEAVLSAGFVPRAEALPAALHALDQPRDPLVDSALRQTMRALEPHWRPAMDAGKLTFAKPGHREFVEEGLGVGLERRLAEFLKDDAPSAEEVDRIREQLLERGTDAEVRTLVDALANGRRERSPRTTIALLEVLGELSAKSKSSRAVRRSLGGIRGLVGHEHEAIAMVAAETLGAWGVAGRNELGRLEDDSLPSAVKQALAVALATTSGERYAAPLASLARSEDLGTRHAAVVGLVRADAKRGIEEAARLLAEDPGTTDPAAVVRAVLEQRRGAGLLNEALEGVDLHATVMTRVDEFHRDTGLLPESLARRFEPSPTAKPLTADLLAEDPRALLGDVESLGDPARGEDIFRRRSLACTKCHAVGSAGPTLGPNLVAVGSAGKTDYLIQSILKPNAAIAEHFEARTFVLADGTVRTGIVTYRSETEVVFHDPAQQGREVRLAADEIEEEVPASSLMPSGLADHLHSRAEFLDLIKFLSVLGKPGPYANNERPVVRNWRVIAAPAGNGLPADDASWQPAYSKVDGELPAEDLPPGERVLARGLVDVMVAGTVRLEIDGPSELTVRVDDSPVEDLETPIDLERGRHSLTVEIRDPSRSRGLRVELKPGDDTVRLQTVGGP